MTTLAELRQQVRDLTGILSTSVLPDSDVDRFVNEAHTFLLTLGDWPMLRQEVSWVHPADQADYDLSASLTNSAYRVIDVFVQENAGARPRQLFERDAPIISEDRTGGVREFNWDADTSVIKFFPTPSAEQFCTGVFVVEPTPLVLDTDLPMFPARFAQAVSLLAASRVLEREGDSSGRSQTFEQRSFQTIEQAKRVLMTPARRTVTLGGRRTRGRGVRRGAW